MTVTEPTRRATGGAGGERLEPATTDGMPRILGRLLGVPLWGHAAALAVLLVLLLPVVGTDAVFSADEGAALAQGDVLASGEGWTVDHPFPEADPDGEAFYLDRTSRGDDGFAPFAKHPLYAVVVAGALAVAGVAGVFAVSLAGVVAASLFAALLARRLSAALAVPTLWVVGLGTPLLFDGYLAMAHTIGAALVAGAALALVRVLEGRPAAVPIAAAAIALGLAVFFRNEALIAAGGLGAAVGIEALRRRSLAVFVAAAVAPAGALLAYFVEPAMRSLILSGSGTGTFQIAEHDYGLLDGRLNALQLTWLRPGLDVGTAQAMLVLAGFACALAAGLLLRSARPDTGLIRFVVLIGAGVLAVRAALSPEPVPGLWPAVPLLATAVLTLRRGSFSNRVSAVLITASGLFATGVLATQYSIGGQGEWGGRFFAIGLPLVVPPALIALRQAVGRLDAGSVRLLAGLGAVATVAGSVHAVRTLASFHDQVDRIVDGVTEAEAASDPGDGGSPVVVTTHPAVGRFAWDEVEGGRWLTTTSELLPDVATQVRDTGVEEFVLVTTEPGDLEENEVYEVVDLREPLGGWNVATVRFQ